MTTDVFATGLVKWGRALSSTIEEARPCWGEFSV